LGTDRKTAGRKNKSRSNKNRDTQEKRSLAKKNTKVGQGGELHPEKEGCVAKAINSEFEGNEGRWGGREELTTASEKGI